MNEVIIERTDVNLAQLDREMRAVFGPAISGVSAALNEVTVHFVDNVTAQQQTQARQIVQAHDPNQQTPEQQRAAEQRQTLMELRQVDEVLDFKGIGNTAADVRKLGRKVALLELEIEAMRRRE